MLEAVASSADAATAHHRPRTARKGAHAACCTPVPANAPPFLFFTPLIGGPELLSPRPAPFLSFSPYQSPPSALLHLLCFLTQPTPQKSTSSSFLCRHTQRHHLPMRQARHGCRLSELSNGGATGAARRCWFEMKVMDKASLESHRKLSRAHTEREILRLLDHPFLPTFYAHFETDRFACLVMEFCPGDDLHALRQRQPGKHFPEHAARFYDAEALLALEYLHILGVVSLTIMRSSLHSDPRNAQSCAQPACIQPTCFITKLFS